MTERELRDLFSRIPNKEHCDGCHDCAIRCSGAIRLSRFEWRSIADFIEDRLPGDRLAALLAEDKRFDLGDGVSERFCILYDRQAGGCAVYPARPLVCRLLGHVEFMPCPLGRVPSVLPDGPAIMQRYARLELRTLAEWFAEEPSPKLAKALRHRKELSPRARCEGTEGDQSAH